MSDRKPQDPTQIEILRFGISIKRWCFLALCTCNVCSLDAAQELCEVTDTRSSGSEVTVAEIQSEMRRAAGYWYENVASHGGYVYHYSLDLEVRWGEGLATEDQIWIQPPGTPTVGMAFLRAYEATSDPFYLKAATDAAEAIVYGQLKSGGWTQTVDFNPRGSKVALYRNGRGKGKNNSSLDDGQTQSALKFLIQMDRALNFEQPSIHQACTVGLDALLAAQFENGAFPQVWTKAVEGHPRTRATLPRYDWRTEGRIKEYWTLYTLNDNVAGYVAETLIEADNTYEDPRVRRSLRKLGQFLIDAQLPQPQPGWAQQYNFEMIPVWARKFEPPAVAADETQEVISTLILLHRHLDDDSLLAPIPAALDWLEASVLPDGRLARYYELSTNTPLYMRRNGQKYSLTYDDGDLPKHYGWKVASCVELLRDEWNRSGDLESSSKSSIDPNSVRKVLADLDDQGRWVVVRDDRPLVGQPKIARGESYLSSEVFSHNLELLSRYLKENP